MRRSLLSPILILETVSTVLRSFFGTAWPFQVYKYNNLTCTILVVCTYMYTLHTTSEPEYLLIFI